MPDFKKTKVSSVQMDIPLKADGNIATYDDTQASVKKFTIDGISADATLAQASAVFSAFFSDICNTGFDDLSAKKTIVQEVVS